MMTGGKQEVLSRDDVLVGLESTSMNEAIELVGGRLAERGIVAPSYVEGMKRREETVSTYLGNGVAMPHGTFEDKDAIAGTGIVVAQFPEGVDWGSGTAHIVIGLAAEGDDHVTVLSQMAEVLQDEDLCEMLWKTEDGDLLYRTLSGSNGSNGSTPDVLEQTVKISNAAGLHARPATEIVQLAGASAANLVITKGEKSASAASIMSVLALGAANGDEVSLRAEGGSSADGAALLEAAVAILTTSEAH